METLLHRELQGEAAIILSDLKWHGTQCIRRNEEIHVFDGWGWFRESVSNAARGTLRETYRCLTWDPVEGNDVRVVGLTPATMKALGRVKAPTDIESLDREKQRILQLYAESLLGDFGGLSIVDKEFFPDMIMILGIGRR